MLPNTKEGLETATALVATGKGDSLMERSTSIIPITAYRYHSLAGMSKPFIFCSRIIFQGYLTDDDMFSSDLPSDILKRLFQHITIKTLWVYSMSMLSF
jgi:hypothetical protein